MKQVLAFFIVFCAFVNVVGVVDAHVGGGPPFLQVNGNYAQTNQYYLGTSPISLPQDFAPNTYLVTTPIKFDVDTKALLIPADIIQKSIFRWTFSQNSKEYFYGSQVTHTFTTPQSYLISLEVKSPDQANFQLIDTMQLDVLPSSSYHLPDPKFSVVTSNMDSSKPLIFKSNVTFDKSTSGSTIQWDFGDGQTSRDPNAIHIYKNFNGYTTYFAILRATDKNNFSKDTGIIVESVQGKLVFVDKNGHKNTIPISTDFAAESAKLSNSSGVPPIAIIAGVATLFLASAFVLQLALEKK